MVQAYVFAGAAGSGRRALVADLIATGLSSGVFDGPVAVLLPEGEPPDGNDAVFAGRADVLRWKSSDKETSMPAWDASVQTLFILTDGTADPVDQFESLAGWFAAHPEVELARIITLVPCRLFFENPALKLWLDACVHFSDVVLLSRRENVPNKWISDLQNRFHKECYPCLFALVKNQSVENPAEILFPEARRMSLAYDFFGEGGSDSFEGDEYEIVDETGGGAEVPDMEDDDDDSSSEPYFERDAAGRRKIRLPDITDYLK